ncbi:MAG TPA: DUF1501 domain-containing protein [Candidatus Saccharimonadales bacterium]|nr:DUF1501 domain-containing protein [Candidatus Saccharimonadales bacterium]
MSDYLKYLRDHTAKPEDFLVTRRQFLNRFGMGLGALGLATLLGDEFARTANAAEMSPLTPRAPHFPVKAKRVVHIFAQGAPSQVDTWDPKPALERFSGKTLPGANGLAMPSPFKFTPRGKAGIPVSEVFTRLGEHVDEMAIIRSMYTDIPSHEVATVMMNTGSLRLAKPSMGSWVLYGLGTENQNMPGFISLRPGNVPPGGSQNWHSAFLPGVYQGTSINTKSPSVDQMIENIRNQFLGQKEQRHQLDLVHKLNAMHSQNLQKDEQLEARIEAFEMAYKMQMEATDAFDVSKESQSIRDSYGNSAQGQQMLIARRLLERGVRVVQVWAGGWDHHNNLEDRLPKSAREIDQPAAAFLQDLKERGLLDSTLVIWGGEFGRKPTRDKNGNDNPGRDHNNRGFSAWLAGGGVKGGTVYGATDEFGAAAVENRVHVHDLHATILRLLGFDHEKLTYRYNGRDFRLTDVHGNVVKGVIA